jgi:hypothetical protein
VLQESQASRAVVSRDKVVRRLCKLEGLQCLSVHLSKDRNSRRPIVEELHLERLATNEDIGTKEGLENELEE